MTIVNILGKACIRVPRDLLLRLKMLDDFNRHFRFGTYTARTNLCNLANLTISSIFVRV